MTAPAPSTTDTTFMGVARPGTGFAAMAAAVHSASRRRSEQAAQEAAPEGSAVPAAPPTVASHTKAKAPKQGGAKQGGAKKGGKKAGPKGAPKQAPSSLGSFGSARWRAAIAAEQTSLLEELRLQAIVSLEGFKYVVQYDGSTRQLTAEEADLVGTPITEETSNEDALRVVGLLRIVRRTLKDTSA